jgi:hypothetical protein
MNFTYIDIHGQLGIFLTRWFSIINCPLPSNLYLPWKPEERERKRERESRERNKGKP